MTNVGNRAIGQFQAVKSVLGDSLAGKTSTVKRREQPITATIAGKHAAGPIGAVSTGCQANNQQIGLRSTQVSNRLPPIIEFAVGFSFGRRDVAAIIHQSRALCATFDRFIQLAPSQRSRRLIRFQWSNLF